MPPPCMTKMTSQLELLSVRREFLPPMHPTRHSLHHQHRSNALEEFLVEEVQLLLQILDESQPTIRSRSAPSQTR